MNSAFVNHDLLIYFDGSFSRSPINIKRLNDMLSLIGHCNFVMEILLTLFTLLPFGIFLEV